MKKFSNLLIAVPLLVGGIAFSGMHQTIEAQQSGNDIRLRTARFWRGDSRTLLEGVVGLPVAASVRTIELAVSDSAGRVLHTESWTDSASANASALAALNAEITSKLELVLLPGSYRVALRRSQNGQVDSTVSLVRGFAATPLVSDIVLSARMRVLGEGEEPSAAEMKRGRYAIERGTRVTVLPTEPRLWYYLELYRQGADSIAQLDFRVYRQNSDSSLVRVTRQVAVTQRGTVDAAALVVQGLPPGDYRLALTARAGNREETREALFTMGSFESAPVAAQPAGATQSEAALYERYFTLAIRPDAEINHLVEALTTSAPSEAVSENAVNALSTDAKRRFLARYWSRVPDPDPATPQHELLEEYSERVDYVVARFTEHRGRSGVRTDRGLYYLRFGQPDARQTIQMGNRRELELWKYTRGRAVKIAFLDETGFQNFNMIYVTGDPATQSLPDWADRIGRNEREAIQALINF